VGEGDAVGDGDGVCVAVDVGDAVGVTVAAGPQALMTTSATMRSLTGLP
jgi:hypothetical protein